MDGTIQAPYQQDYNTVNPYSIPQQPQDFGPPNAPLEEENGQGYVQLDTTQIPDKKQLAKIAMPGEESIVIVNNDVRRRTEAQNWGYYLSYIFTFLRALIVWFILSWGTLMMTSEFTYFRSGTTSCDRFYSYDALRFTTFAFAIINGVDIFMSFNIGQKFIGGYTLITNVVAIVGNLIILAIWFFGFVLGCNVDGSGDTGNFCQNRLFCGINSILANVQNNCLYLNPTNLRLCDTKVTLATLPPDGVFLMIFILMILCTAFVIAGTLFSLIIPETTEMARSTTQFVDDSLKQLANGKLPPADTVGVAPKIVKERNIYDIIGFFTIYKRYHVMFYFPVMLMIVLGLLYTLIILGWFQQNVKPFKRVFEQDPIKLNCSVFKNVTDWTNALFYSSIGFILIAFWSQSRLGNLFSNWIAVYGAAFGFLVTCILLAWTTFDQWIYCNRPGFSIEHNMCHDPQRYCATYLDANGTMPMWTNPSSGCKNAYTCPETYSLSDLTMNENYQALLIFLAFVLIVFACIFVYSVVLELRFRKYVGTRKSSDEENEKAWEDFHRDYTVKNNIPQWAIQSVVEGRKFQYMYNTPMAQGSADDDVVNLHPIKVEGSVGFESYHSDTSSEDTDDEEDRMDRVENTPVENLNYTEGHDHPNVIRNRFNNQSNNSNITPSQQQRAFKEKFSDYEDNNSQYSDDEYTDDSDQEYGGSNTQRQFESVSERLIRKEKKD